MKQMLFIVNPASGREDIRRSLMDVISYFTANGYDVLCHPTQRPKEAVDLIRNRGGQFDMIVCCGGDGTLNETFTGVMGIQDNRPIIGYIPAGTVNDFATSLNIPKTILEAAHNIVEGIPYAVDVGGFNQKQYFSYVAAFGAFTKVSYETPHASKQVLGRAAYLLSGLLSLTDIHPIHTVMDTGHDHFEGDVLFGMISNATSVGGFKAMDDSLVKLDDGENEVCLIRAPTLLSDYNAIINSILSRDFNSEFFYFSQSDRADFHFEEEVSWTLDGEYGGKSKFASVRNIPKPLQIIVPETVLTASISQL